MHTSRILLFAAACLSAAGQQAIAAEEARQNAADASVEELLQSLTFEDFALREKVVRQIAEGGAAMAEQMTRLAADEGSPAHLQARYMLRRTFFELAPGVLERIDEAPPTDAAAASKIFMQMVELYPLDDVHHHGGLQKRALLCERVGRYDLALEAYRQWRPEESGCGTCAASMSAWRVERMIHCHRQLKQLDAAAALCWTVLRETDGLAPMTSIAMNLVDIYDAQGRLGQLETDLDRLGKSADAPTALEYATMRRDFNNGNIEKYLKHLWGARLGQPADLEPRFQRDWRSRAVAESLGRLGERATPILRAHFRQLPDHGVSVAGWAFEALRLTGSPAAVDVAMEAAEKDDRALSSFNVGAILQQFPEEATAKLTPLLKVDKPYFRHAAIRQLANLGTNPAAEAIIENMPHEAAADPTTAAVAESCAWGLWRLTGESLGMEEWKGDRIAREGRDRWREWWRQRPSNFKAKSPAWWRSPESAPRLVAALDWPRPYSDSAEMDLMALEHPALLRLLQPRDDSPGVGSREARRFSIAKLWLKFDPAATMPVFIEHSDTPLIEVKHLLPQLTGQNFGADEAAWRRWWETHPGELQVQPTERWWRGPM